MKSLKWYKRYCILCKITNNLNKIDRMGCYKFLGNWGNRVQSKYTRLIKRYNKLKFFWQKPKRIM